MRYFIAHEVSEVDSPGNSTEGDTTQSASIQTSLQQFHQYTSTLFLRDNLVGQVGFLYIPSVLNLPALCAIQAAN